VSARQVRRRLKNPFVSFAQPPTGSVLAEATAGLHRDAASFDITDPAFLRPRVVAALKAQGMPSAPGLPWYERVVDTHVDLARVQLAVIAERPARRDGPDLLAAAFAMSVFLRLCDASPGRPLQDVYVATAEELGPGVGLHEVEFLVRWFCAETRCLTSSDRSLAEDALAAVEQMDFCFLRTNLSVSEDEFIAIVGTLDGMRFA